MPLVREIRKRGATGWVSAYGEVLFKPGSDLSRFTNSLSNRTTAAAARLAPSNKRPRWGHYGKPLKNTFTTSSEHRPSLMRIESVVGSTADYSAYADQGTGIFAGRGPYQAKVIPPWTRGDGSLYERSWHPPGQQARHVVWIKGQKGQRFMTRALEAAFRSRGLRLRNGVLSMSYAKAPFPDRLENFIGNTRADAGFRASLTEWRAWRDKAFNSGRGMGDGAARAGFRAARERARAARVADRKARTRADYRAREAERSRRNRAKARETREEQTKPDRKKRLTVAERAVQSAKREMLAFYQRNPGLKPAGYNSAGFWYIDRGGSRRFKPWGIRTADLFADSGAQHKAPHKHT